MTKKEAVELGFDHPLRWQEALKDDKLGRLGYARAAVQALQRVNSATSLVLSVEGAWGSGKTSTLAMIEALLRDQESEPVILHFNPWLVGDRDALLRSFLSKIAHGVELADHAAAGKKVATELKAYSKVLDVVKLVPGAEPWVSLVKSVFDATGESVGSVADYKTPDIEAKKLKVEEALRSFGRPIIVFVDDIDRLFPLEAFEMVRIVKAVGDLPNVGYVLAWDSQYVSDALSAANVPRSETYLDKIVQIRLPLPAIGPQARTLLINEALTRLHPDAGIAYFPNAQSRLSRLYFAGLRELLEQPRDYARVFNTVAVVEPPLRGEVVLADIIGLAALMVKAPQVYNLLRKEPQWFVGALPRGARSHASAEVLLKEGSEMRIEAFNQSSHPSAVRSLVHRLFPLTAKAEEKVLFGGASEVEGHLGAPTRLCVALQLHVSGVDISFVSARRYLTQPEERDTIASSLSQENCIEFLELLGDVAQSTSGAGISDVEDLCLSLACLPDTEPFTTHSRAQGLSLGVSAEHVAVRAITSIAKTAGREDVARIAARVAAGSEESLTVAMEVFADSYLSESDDTESLRCTPEDREEVESALFRNILQSALTGRLFSTTNPGYVLSRLARAMPTKCSELFDAIKKVDPSWDNFVLALCAYSIDSTNGQRYALPRDPADVEAYCSIDELKSQAKKRLTHEDLVYPARAAWRAIDEGRSVYGVDGSYPRRG